VLILDHSPTVVLDPSNSFALGNHPRWSSFAQNGRVANSFKARTLLVAK